MLKPEPLPRLTTFKEEIPLSLLTDYILQHFSLTESDSQYARTLYTEYQEELAEKQKFNDPKRKFKCDLCYFRALTAVGLKKHLNKVHPYKD